MVARKAVSWAAVTAVSLAETSEAVWVDSTAAGTDCWTAGRREF